MSRYTPEDEERIHVQAQVRAWAAAGVIDHDQAAALDAGLRTALRRTNGFLRAILALFTAVIVAAFVGLVLISLGISGDIPTAVVLAIAAVSCVALSEYVIGEYQVYRYGVEEALAAAAAVLAAIAAGNLAHAAGAVNQGVVMLLIGAVCGLGLFVRFGFVYAAIAATIAAAALPFAIDLTEAAQRSAAALIGASVFAWTHLLHQRRGDDVHRDDYATVRAAAFVVAYVSVNVRLFGDSGQASVPAWFYWTTYVISWLMPAGGLAFALRHRDRPLILVAMASALATFYTNTPYLGWRRQTWDPILLGVLLVAVATVIRRWLERGPNGERHGFTAQEIGAGDRRALDALATASAVWPQQPHHASTTTSPSQFEGGRSGGAGGGAAY